MLKFTIFLVLLWIAWEDINTLQVARYKLLLCFALALISSAGQHRSLHGVVLSLRASFVLIICLYLCVWAEKKSGRFFIGAADVLLAAALAPSLSIRDLLRLLLWTSLLGLLYALICLALLQWALPSGREHSYRELYFPLTPFYVPALIILRLGRNYLL